MKIIRFQRQREPITEVRFCDLCSSQPTFRTKNHSYYVCIDCSLKFDAKDLVIIPDSHISQVCAQKPERKPYRPRKRRNENLRRQLAAVEQANASYLISCEHAERERAEQASAKVLKANNRLLKKYFDSSLK